MPLKLSAPQFERLKTLFYHQVTPEQATRMEALRVSSIHLAVAILESASPSRPQSVALTHLEETLMRGIQAIALEGAPIIPLGIEVSEE